MPYVSTAHACYRSTQSQYRTPGSELADHTLRQYRTPQGPCVLSVPQTARYHSRCQYRPPRTAKRTTRYVRNAPSKRYVSTGHSTATAQHDTKARSVPGIVKRLRGG
eukprot:488626-Rhodomonas_salina.1